MGWPTPTSEQGGPDPDTINTGGSRQPWRWMAGWATPRVNSGHGNPERATDGKVRLEDQVQGAGWATPSARDWKSEKATDEFNEKRDGHPRGKPLSYEVTKAHGATSTGSPAQTEKRGQLNPAFSLWLQGYPPQWMDAVPSAEWVRSVVRETASSRK